MVVIVGMRQERTKRAWEWRRRREEGLRRAQIDDTRDSDRREGSFCDSSESEEEGEGTGEISDGIARSNGSHKGKGREQKRSNSVA